MIRPSIALAFIAAAYLFVGASDFEAALAGEEIAQAAAKRALRAPFDPTRAVPPSCRGPRSQWVAWRSDGGEWRSDCVSAEFPARRPVVGVDKPRG